MTDDPVVVTEPGMRWGYPHVGGIPVEAVAGMVWSGESADKVAADYGLTRPQVLVACWWTARYGSGKQRARWAGWLAGVESRLWHGDYDIPDPPDRTDRPPSGPHWS